MMRGSITFHIIGKSIKINWLAPYGFDAIELYVDGRRAGTHRSGRQFWLDMTPFAAGPHVLQLTARGSYNGRPFEESASFSFEVPPVWQGKPASPESLVLEPGDILTACDNELHVPAGYMGHSAIVVGPDRLVEAVVLPPYIRLDTVRQFIKQHPRLAIYRPKNGLLGKQAAQFALWYWQTSESNRLAGQMVPPFSFSATLPLDDMWVSVYCSKLVWLSYYYGAGYKFPNDYYLFSPEDLDYVLQRDPNFMLLYKHPEFLFKIDT